MQVKEQHLSRHLADTLKPAYLVAGNETLLVEEACDAIIQAARKQGYTERSVHHAEGSFRWSEIIHDSASISLFAERKILDIRVAGKIDQEGSKIIRSWLDAADGETVMLIRCGRLDGNQRKSAWFKALEQKGVVTLIWEMDVDKLPDWLHTRLAKHGLKAEADAVAYLSERVEGNLLAADQEIKKLTLMDLREPISLAAMIETLEDVSHFTVFDLINAAMQGNPRRTRHISLSLQQAGINPIPVLAALTSQLKHPKPQVLPPQSRDALQAFRARVPDPLPVLAECSLIDQQTKGQFKGDAWQSLEKLMLRIAGLRQVNLPSTELLEWGAG